MNWIALAFIAPLLWSIVVLVDDHLLHNVYRSPRVGAIISGFFGLVPLISLLWLNIESLNPPVAALGVGAGFLTIIYYYFYFHALEVDEPSVVTALFALTPALLPILAYFTLGETLTPRQLVGFVVVLAFTFLLAAVDIRRFKFSRALLPIFVASLLIAFSLVSSKYVYEEVGFYTGYMLFSLGMGLGATFFVLQEVWIHLLNKHPKPEFRFPKKQAVAVIGVLVASEGLNLAAEFASNLAVSRGPVTLVELIQNTLPMFILLIALALHPFFPKYFREAESGRVKFKLLMMTGIIGGLALTLS